MRQMRKLEGVSHPDVKVDAMMSIHSGIESDQMSRCTWGRRLKVKCCNLECPSPEVAPPESECHLSHAKNVEWRKQNIVA